MCIMLRDSHHLPIDCLYIHRRMKAAYNYITTTEKRYQEVLIQLAEVSPLVAVQVSRLVDHL